MNSQVKKYISIVLVFMMLNLTGSLIGSERRGAEIAIQKTDGNVISGELIAVKKNSILLVDAETSFDVNVDVNQIQIIHILKKARSGIGALSGLLVGGAIGVATVGKGGTGQDDGCVPCNAPGSSSSQKNLIGGIAIASLGALVGALIGTAAGQDEIIILDGMSSEQKDTTLEKLRKKARIPDYM